jgi:FlaA1/EpsC-like NDP-sugar epimerase
MNDILITGSCGTIGSGLISRILNDYPDSKIFCLDNNETQLFFQEQTYLQEEKVQFFLGDVRDIQRLRKVMQGVGTVFHTAALKHVVMCERSPMDTTNTNILGVNNIIQAASEAKVQKVIFTSSDKAVNPTNVMGTSKLMGERLITAANTYHQAGETLFSSTRFGNVMGSTGSVIPIFREQIKNGGPITLTDSAMTRFVMSVKQAVQLLIDSAKIAKGGEVFITKMPVLRISDLAEVMIKELAPIYGHSPEKIKIEMIGTKPGEKLYEELMSEEETRRTVELPSYFSVLPAFKGLYRFTDYDYEDLVSDSVINPYISRKEKILSKEKIFQLLKNNGFLKPTENYNPDHRYWPGDKQKII